MAVGVGTGGRRRLYGQHCNFIYIISVNDIFAISPYMLGVPSNSLKNMVHINTGPHTHRTQPFKGPARHSENDWFHCLFLHQLAQKTFQKLGTILYCSRVMSCHIPVHEKRVNIYCRFKKKKKLMRITWHIVNDETNVSAIATKSLIG